MSINSSNFEFDKTKQPMVIDKLEILKSKESIDILKTIQDPKTPKYKRRTLYKVVPKGLASEELLQKTPNSKASFLNRGDTFKNG